MNELCPHTTNPLQRPNLCRRCQLLKELAISVYQMPQGDYGCAISNIKTLGIMGFGVMSDGFKTRYDAEEWAIKRLE